MSGSALARKDRTRSDLITGSSGDVTPETENYLDKNVLANLPENVKILSIQISGASAWVHTIRIDALLEDGTIKKYFQKYQSGLLGHKMMVGTHDSEVAIRKYAPENVPRPVGWGNYHEDENIWFYLAEYHDMVDEVPMTQQFVSTIARLHQNSMGNSPDGKFGFHVRTHMANLTFCNDFEDSWEVWYTNAMASMFHLEELSHGKDDLAFEELKKGTLSKTIPRLLRPLEAGGRKITPCLLHGDLWPGNCMPDADTDEIMIFDSCAFWGHHEADLGSWRAPRYRMGRPFMKEYQKRMGMDFPENDWDDRNALYALFYEMLCSALYPSSDRFRNQARSEMKRLLDKFPNGFGDWTEPAE